MTIVMAGILRCFESIRYDLTYRIWYLKFIYTSGHAALKDRSTALTIESQAALLRHYNCIREYLLAAPS